jgi:hypothetical protein
MGSKTTQKTEIPAYIEEAGKLALERAKQIQAMGYVPYMGPEVVAINPYEQAVAQNVGGMASAFGLSAPAAMDMGGMPTVTQGGITGYTSYPGYMSSLERLREVRPEMYDYFSNLTRFDPITGALNPEYDAMIEKITAPKPAQTAVGTGSSSEGFPGVGYASVDDSFYDPNEFDPLGPTNRGYSIDIGDVSIPIGPQHEGGEGGEGGKSIVCTEMYRQTKLDDWSDAMKTWYVYQKKHLTPYHEIGYHAVFKPFVLGMKKSKLITKVGAYAAKKRTKHLRYVLTKGKSKSSFVGKVICNILEPQMYLAGRVVSAIKGGS